MPVQKSRMTQTRDQVQARLQLLAAIAAQAQAQGIPIPPQPSGIDATDAAAANLPDSQVVPRDQQQRAARRKYRQDVLGIDDLRHATADQIQQAQGDRKALLSREDVVRRRDALAYAQAHGGNNALPDQQAVTAGKPANATVVGGRPVVVAGAPAPAPAISASHLILGQPIAAKPQPRRRRR